MSAIAVGVQLRAELTESGLEEPQPVDLAGLEWKIAAQGLAEACGKRLEPKVGDSTSEVLADVSGLADLQLGVERQGDGPGRNRIGQLGERLASVFEQQPRPLGVEGDHLGDPVGPA